MSYLFPPKTITFEAALRDIGSKNVKARLAAAHALADVTDAGDRGAAEEALIGALQDDSTDIRAQAAMSLGEIGSEAAVEPLIARFTDLAPVVRQSAAIALGRLGFHSAFEPLARALADAPPDLRFQAATSLVEVDPERAYEPLLAALEDGDGEVVGAAALGLGAIGDPRAADQLAPLLERWGNPATRFDIAYALADLDDPRGLDVLVELAGERAFGWDALDAILRVGDARVADPLAPLLRRMLLPLPIKLRAAAAILELAPDHHAVPEARKVLLAGLRSRKLHDRGIAVQLLTEVGGAWALPALDKLRSRRAGQPLAEELDAAIGRLRNEDRP